MIKKQATEPKTKNVGSVLRPPATVKPEFSWSDFLSGGDGYGGERQQQQQQQREKQQ